MTEPEKTMVAYKLFRTKASAPGKLFPLFIGKDRETPVGQWVEGEFIPTPGYAPRPGWHVGTLPIAPHLMKRDGSKPEDRVWAEVLVPADADYTDLAAVMPTKDLREKVPVSGFYRFPRPANQGGEWILAGAIKVLRVLSDKQVQEILQQQKGTECH